MKVEILTIGDELLLGFTTDTNSGFLSRELSTLGVEVVRHTSIPDDRDRIGAEVSAALSRTGAVITSGGLGPTTDDISVESVAAALGRKLVEDAPVLAHMAALFRSRGITAALSATNKRQAMLPDGAEPMLNRHGTAPGVWIDAGDSRWIAMLPGVPRELRGLFADELRARIQSRVISANVIRSRTLRTTGIAESALAELIVKSGITVHSLAYLPGARGVDLRVTVRDMPENDATAVLDSSIIALRSVVGDRAYGEDNDDLAAVVLEVARRKSLKISVAESCTGGMLGARLSAVPGASDVFIGGLIAYANDVKMKLLGVPSSALAGDGAVSEATVRAMAAGVCALTGSEIGLAVSGVAGPGGGTEAKPVGTVWVCAQVNGDARAAMRVLPGDRDEIRQRAAQMALDLARHLIPD